MPTSVPRFRRCRTAEARPKTLEKKRGGLSTAPSLSSALLSASLDAAAALAGDATAAAGVAVAAHAAVDQAAAAIGDGTAVHTGLALEGHAAVARTAVQRAGATVA